MAEAAERLELGYFSVVKLPANRLGEGTFGEVWKAEHLHRSDTYAAVKEIKISNRSWPYVQRETRLLSNCDHQNIVKLFDVSRTGNLMYICMEYCADGNINSFMRSRRLSNGICLKFITDVAEGLNYLHQRTPPIVHRDLKPQNVLVARDNDQNDTLLKLADFGLAKEFPNSSTAVGATGNVGTLAWMAPEVCVNEGESCQYHRPADVFSFGLFILSLLTHQQGRDLLAHTGMYCVLFWWSCTFVMIKQAQELLISMLACWHVM